MYNLFFGVCIILILRMINLTEVLFIEKQITPKDSRLLCTVGFVLFTGIHGVIEKQRWCPHGYLTPSG